MLSVRRFVFLIVHFFFLVPQLCYGLTPDEQERCIQWAVEYLQGARIIRKPPNIDGRAYVKFSQTAMNIASARISNMLSPIMEENLAKEKKQLADVDAYIYELRAEGEEREEKLKSLKEKYGIIHSSDAIDSVREELFVPPSYTALPQLNAQIMAQLRPDIDRKHQEHLQALQKKRSNVEDLLKKSEHEQTVAFLLRVIDQQQDQIERLRTSSASSFKLEDSDDED